MITICVLCLSFSDATAADESIEGRRKAALELLVVSHTPEVLQDSIRKSLDLQIQANPGMARFRPAMEAFFSKHMSWESLKDEFSQIYAQEFTEKELQEMTAFYKTPTGQKMARKVPVLMGRGMELGQRRVQENMAELQQAIRAELEKEE